MVERQDIDALLISALYGELTPAEETRLATHLESHPADRTALDDLTRAREVLHQSRILAFQYEPPQSISALLIQEASRRAPKKPAEGEGWFARFVRSFMQHPAMAAAAMIVVVVGAASIVSRNSDNMVAETPPVEISQTTQAGAPTVAAETPNANTVVAAPSAGPNAEPKTGLDSDQFQVALADGEKADDKAAVGDKLTEKNKAEGLKQAAPETDPNVAFYDSTGVADRKKGGDAVTAKPTVTKGPSKDTGVELRRPDPTPKELEESAPDLKPEEKLAAKQTTERQYKAEPAPPADDAIRGNREQPGYLADGRTGNGSKTGNVRAGGGGNAGSGAAAPGAIAPTTPAPTQPTTTAQNQAPRNATPPRATTSPPPPPANTPPAKTAPAPRQEIATDSATTRDAQKAKDKNEKAANDPNLAWAKDQHAALVTAVRANNCGRAANIALSIANRAPGYYQQNVETDRSVKECIAYINSERERDAEVRASRAKKSQLKNAEPAAPKRAADQPGRATSTDSSK